MAHSIHQQEQYSQAQTVAYPFSDSPRHEQLRPVMKKISSTPPHAGRRRLLGALAVVGSVPAAARTRSSAMPQASTGVSSRQGPADAAFMADGVVSRERWLLRRDDA